MKVNAITCSKCSDTIYSRVRHDCRSCSCGKVYIDGGFDYLRVGGEEAVHTKVFKLKIKATKKELFDDWNLRKDKLGLIKKLKVYKNVDDMFKELKEDRKKHPVYYFFHDIYWRVYQHLDMLPLRVKSFFKRGFKGWSPMDTWGFDYYLANIISSGVKYLIKYGNHGVHDSKAFKQIAKTFDTAKKISEGDLVYLPSKGFKWTEYKRWKRISKKLKLKDRVMTKRESLAYERGWKIFQTEFFRLWD